MLVHRISFISVVNRDVVDVVELDDVVTDIDVDVVDVVELDDVVTDIDVDVVEVVLVVNSDVINDDEVFNEKLIKLVF